MPLLKNGKLMFFVNTTERVEDNLGYNVAISLELCIVTCKCNNFIVVIAGHIVKLKICCKKELLMIASF